MGRLAVGVDVGGTNIKAALVDPSGRIVRQVSAPTGAEDGPAVFVTRVAKLLGEWKGLGRAPVGLGIAGDVDHEAGRLRLSPNLPGWQGFPLRQALARRLKRRVSIENDANCAVWGGFVTELKRKPRHVVGVTLGTGVGGGLILDGRLHHGATGSAGEIGHMKVADPGEPCHCGAHGCLEAYAGTYGIIRTARRILSKDPSEGRALQELCPNLDLLTPKHLAEAAERGDLVAQRVWTQTGRVLALGLSNLVLLLNPEVLLLLGGVSKAGKWILDPLQEGLSHQPFRVPFAAAKVALAENPEGGCIGAALLALEEGA